MATGRACAIALAREGARALLADINPERADHTRAVIEDKGGLAAVFAGDMTSAADCNAVVRAAVDAFEVVAQMVRLVRAWPPVVACASSLPSAAAFPACPITPARPAPAGTSPRSRRPNVPSGRPG